MKPTDKLLSVASSNAKERIDYCWAMLHLHGFITTAESDRVLKRIRKWCQPPPPPIPERSHEWRNRLREKR